VDGEPGLPRKQAKTINLGLPYTMGGAKFCRQVGLPTKTVERRDGSTYEAAGEEGQKLLDQYDARLPYARKIMHHCKEVADERGFIVTMSGRYARFDLWEPTHRWGPPLPWEQAEKQYGASRLRRAFTKDALNRLIQGGSADMIKYSLVALHRAGLTPHLTIHDENGLGALTSPKQAAQAQEIMVNCVELKLPLVVDMDRGRSWGEARPFSAAIQEEMRDT
jgi:DNA polymerase I-like protein with 3'-5' exonuclease and polymerase domains